MLWIKQIDYYILHKNIKAIIIEEKVDTFLEWIGDLENDATRPGKCLTDLPVIPINLF